MANTITRYPIYYSGNRIDQDRFRHIQMREFYVPASDTTPIYYGDFANIVPGTDFALPGSSFYNKIQVATRASYGSDQPMTLFVEAFRSATDPLSTNILYRPASTAMIIRAFLLSPGDQFVGICRSSSGATITTANVASLVGSAANLSVGTSTTNDGIADLFVDLDTVRNVGTGQWGNQVVIRDIVTTGLIQYDATGSAAASASALNIPAGITVLFEVSPIQTQVL